MIANILSFGAIPSDPTKFVVNQVAIQAALATGSPVYVPDGLTFHTQAIVVPANAHSIFGKGTMYAAGGFAMPQYAVLYGVGNVDLTVRDVKVIVPMAAPYLALEAVHFEGATGLHLDHVAAQGYFGIHVVGSVDTLIERCKVPDYGIIGIRAEECFNTKVLACSVTTAQTGAWHGIQSTGGAQVTIADNDVANAGMFGVSLTGSYAASIYQSHSGVVANNRIRDSKYEAINVDNFALFTVSGNQCEWPMGTGLDFGISCFGNPNNSPAGLAQYGTISGNQIYSPCKAGIALCNRVTDVNVTGNQIYHPNASNGTTPYHKSAILLYGGGNARNGVSGNLINDPTGSVQWQVSEYNDGSGMPNFNFIGQNLGAPGTSGRTLIGGANSTRGNPCAYIAGPGNC